jgi:hypothetical protein
MFQKKIYASNYANLAFLDFALFSPIFLLMTFFRKKAISLMTWPEQDILAALTLFSKK